ncbi:hypothetical protein LAV72_02025 [Lysinibacillus xylanilyticus]|uniref:hypothetical protein n=1 Tax=Lysinibacillus xylanilyticus TaxID=582475 RepID=UPI002B253C1B|nr:hypothetical protein [Lysinibacillus xylanilyticus]MEB2298406.1 hypothetical protein [Lysinibacillus xylanilyticus]
MNFIFITSGLIACAISLTFANKNVKEENSIKDKLLSFIDYFTDPFMGPSSLLYLGILLIIVGLIF